MKEAEETLDKLLSTEHTSKQKTSALDLQITNLITEMQRVEAKTNNLKYLLSRMEEDVASQTRQLDTMDKQIHTIGHDVIPPIDSELKSLQGQVNTLKEEIGTELSDTLAENERSMLQQLKSVQTELERDMENQAQVLEDVSIKRQRLESLLEDNLLKRKRELEEEGATELTGNR